MAEQQPLPDTDAPDSPVNRVDITREVRKQLRKLHPCDRRRINQAFRELERDLRPLQRYPFKRLVGPFEGLLSLKVTPSLRVQYEIFSDEGGEYAVVRIVGQREDMYQ